MVNDSGAPRDAAIKLKPRAKVQNLLDIGIRVVAFAYDIYTNSSKNNGVLRATHKFQKDFGSLHSLKDVS